MKGIHAILQIQCPVCTGAFMIGDELVMRVTELGTRTDSPNGRAIGVMVEYLHARCEMPWGER